MLPFIFVIKFKHSKGIFFHSFFLGGGGNKIHACCSDNKSSHFGYSYSYAFEIFICDNRYVVYWTLLQLYLQLFLGYKYKETPGKIVNLF